LTEMGHSIASRVGITMIGRAVTKHYLLFTGTHRFIKTVMPTMLA
jgi:FdhD protein